MKVLKNNYHYEEKNVKNVNPYPRKMVCECCGSELEYEESDVMVGAFGCAYLVCPLCDSETFINGSEKEITLTKDNVEFPAHFYHTSTETGAIETCGNKNVRDAINKAIDYFRENKDAERWFTAYGNLYVQVNRFDGDEVYDVVVANDYYETSIPFEVEDY